MVSAVGIMAVAMAVAATLVAVIITVSAHTVEGKLVAIFAVAGVSAPAIVAAIFVLRGFSSFTFKAILVAGLLVASGAWAGRAALRAGTGAGAGPLGS